MATKLRHNKVFSYDELFNIARDFLNEQKNLKAFCKEHKLVYVYVIRFRNGDLPHGSKQVLPDILNIMGYDMKSSNDFIVTRIDS